MNREGCVMGFFEDELPYFPILRYYQTISKEYRSFAICGETFSNSASNVLLDPANTSCTPLGNYDLILKGWFRHQGRKIAMRNNFKVELAKVFMKMWGARRCSRWSRGGLVVGVFDDDESRIRRGLEDDCGGLSPNHGSACFGKKKSTTASTRDTAA